MFMKKILKKKGISFFSRMCIVIVSVAFLLFLITESDAIIAVIQHTRLKEEIKEEMSDECRAIYNIYQSKNYGDMSLSGVYKLDDIVRVDFKYGALEHSTMYSVWNDLENYMIDEGVLEKEHIRINLAFIPYSEDPGGTGSISNVVKSEYYTELEKYDEDIESWWVYGMIFRNWKEIEDNFKFADGICRCKIQDLEDIPDTDNLEWDNLKYLQLYYYGDDAEYYEQELQNLFPNAEVHVGAEIDW